MERDSFVFYGSFYEALSSLDDATRLECYDAMTQYALSGIEPELDGVAKAIFALIKPQIDANNRRYANGCKGGKPKTNQTITETKPKANQEVTKTKPNENVNDNDNENDNENVNEKKSGGKPQRSFKPPTMEEVKSYCDERRNGVDAQHFMDFYESKGWFIGKNKMKDWKAAVRTWEQRSRSSPSKIEIDDNFRKAMRESEVVDFGI